MTSQAPSPMEEHIRAHERITDTLFSGRKMLLEGVLSKPVTIYVPEAAENGSIIDLLFHFHGTPNVPIQAVDQLGKPIILAFVNQGSGSSVYQQPFLDTAVFEQLIRKVVTVTGDKNINKIYCSSFSAGYGAIRELLKTNSDQIDGVLLIDGLHTDYIPEATPLAAGGKLNTEKLEVFLNYAKLAMQNKRKMLITHSEIFPGTYASTTETAEYLINACGLKRNPVLAWAPMGMQEIANTKSGQFQVRTFAGNSAPDHIDQFHGIVEFIKYFWAD
ncbi:MAG: hypothetical protein ACFHWX_03705 [Bacteroidota bacterium]